MADASKAQNPRIRKPLTQERLTELFNYNPDSGHFVRRISRNGDGNNARAGIRAGSLKKHGYRTLDVDGRRYYEHQIVVFMATGNLPDKRVRIDHKGRDPAINAEANIRVATPRQNCGNRRVNKTNQLGLKGVFTHCDPRRKKRFGARIKINRQSHHLGWFYTPEEAHVAYCKAAVETFGEFACFG